MSKVEELAEKKYPIHSVRIVPARGGGYYADKHLREGFINGYHQAEKDNKLTWEDIALIETISKEFIKNNTTPMTDQDYYQEVLKRLNEYKQKE